MALLVLTALAGGVGAGFHYARRAADAGEGARCPSAAAQAASR
jgi:hypothetical protein